MENKIELIIGVTNEQKNEKSDGPEKIIPESVTPSVDAGCNSLISICISKIAGAPIGSPNFGEANRNQWFEHCAAMASRIQDGVKRKAPIRGSGLSGQTKTKS
jgi:hypothetical protein